MSVLTSPQPPARSHHSEFYSQSTTGSQGLGRTGPTRIRPGHALAAEMSRCQSYLDRRSGWKCPHSQGKQSGGGPGAGVAVGA